MSSAPSFGGPGGHIFDVVAPGLKTHVFTAMLAQHLASELRMRLWTLRSVRGLVQVPRPRLAVHVQY